MSIPPWNPYGNFVTSDPNGIPVDRRPLRLGMYLQNQTFSPNHSVKGANLLQTFRGFRHLGWGGNAMIAVGCIIATVPEVLDSTLAMCQAGLVTGGATALGGGAAKFWAKVQGDETAAEMETEFNSLKSLIISHNKKHTDNQLPVPYLADPSLSERLAEAHISQTNASSTNTVSNVPGNVVSAGIALEALKFFRGLRKN